MLSSTSSSETASLAGPRSLRPILIVLAVCVAVFAVFELVARHGVHRVSRFIGQNHREMNEAVALRQGGKRPTVLIAGTSLLLEGVDFPRLREMMADRWDVHRFVMEQTTYTDWYYGLRRLYAEGSRPDVVVLMMGPTNMVRTVIRGDYFASKMMRTWDFWDVSKVLHLHPTEATNLLASNLSDFYGMKTELRKVALIRMMPDLPRFTQMIIRYDRPPLEETELREVGGERLVALDNLVKSHGGRFIFAIPPRPSVGTASEVLKATGAERGVPVSVAIPQGELGYPYYRDGNHLLPHGAAIYTDRLEPDLRRILSEPDH